MYQIVWISKAVDGTNPYQQQINTLIVDSVLEALQIKRDLGDKLMSFTKL